MLRNLVTTLHGKLHERLLKPSHRQMLNSVAEQGMDLSKPIPLTFYMAFRTNRDAGEAADLLAELDYEVTHEREEGSSHPFEIEIDITLPADAAEIGRHDALMKRIALEHDGRYDDYSILFLSPSSGMGDEHASDPVT